MGPGVLGSYLRRGIVPWLALAIMSGIHGRSARGQYGASPAGVHVFTKPSGESAAAAGEAAPSTAANPGAPTGQPAEGAASQESKPDEKKAEEPKPATRPGEPAQPPDRKELEVRPNEAGLISFSFRGQPWPDVLQWVADISQMSLEWQEAPSGFLDLTTRRQYKVEEVRDLINSILLSRGYTLLRSGEVLMVAKLDKLDVNLVPRVTAEELDQRGDYEIVKTFFDLDRLRAETMAEELKPLLSAYGRISALKTTNRIDVVETAGNLRKLRDLLVSEQSHSGQDFQIREFPLRHARADEVVESLNAILGIEKKPSGPMTPEQLQAMHQAAQLAAQQAQQGGGGPPKKEPETRLAVNRAKNSVIAHAVPDKLAIIEQAIRFLDVPSSQAFGSPMEAVSRVRNYRLTGASPEAVVKILKEMGGLSPSTQLLADEPNHAVIATGPMVDHLTIGRLVEQLNGTGRTFEVIQLRRLSAEFVAGSIEFLMRGAGEDKSNSRRGYYWYYPFRSGGQENQDESKFQVEADIENNRLLLRANQVELEEIRQLLIKLGEDPYDAGQDPTIRVIRTTPGDATESLIERIRRLWPSVRPNPLEVEPPPDALPGGEEVEEPSGHLQNEPPAKDHQQASGLFDPQPTRHMLVALQGDGRGAFGLGEAVAGSAKEAAPRDEVAQSSRPLAANIIPPRPAAPFESQVDDASKGHAPIHVTRSPQGLVVTSRDTEALRTMVDMIDRISSFRPSYRVFTLRHTYARDVAYLLEDIFEEKQKSSSDRLPGRYIYYYDYPPEETKERGRLSARKPLKFIPDSVTNTILVQNADEAQLAEIAELIKLYDRVEPPDSQSIRRTKLLEIRFGDANEIGDVIKDVYRDLLSPNDRALAQQNQEQQKTQPLFSYFDYPATSDSDSETKVPKFKGLLSVGVDKKSNTLVVSAPQFLLVDVERTVLALDEAARPQPQVYRVVTVSPSLVSSRMVDALAHVQERSKSIGSSKTQSTTGAQQPPQPPNGNTQPPAQSGVQPSGASYSGRR